MSRTAAHVERGRSGTLLGLLVATLLVALVGGVAPPRARAETGLEQAVGPIDPATAALLPDSDKLWGPYTLEPTPKSCPTGALSCVNTTLATMQKRADSLASTCSHNAIFSVLYLDVTKQYKIDTQLPDFFVRPALVNTEDTVFSDLYSAAFTNWQAGRPGTVPPIWRLAFAAAGQKKVSGTGDALVGMVAHIQRDLAFALYRIQLGNRSDHEAINTMLKQVYPDAVVELARRFDPTINPTGLYVPGTGDLVVDAIATWRDQAWNDAQALLAAPTATDRDRVAMGIERHAWNSGLQIYLSSLNTSVQTQARDSYCATHWNS